MHVGRTLPPAAAPIGPGEFVSGLRGMLDRRRAMERFQSELREYFGVRHCFLVSSGKAAFALILLALKELFPGRDDVIIPAFTCYTVPSSVVRAGLRIRTCDLRQGSLDLDLALLSAMLPGSARLLAVVPTHLYGYPSDVVRVRKLVTDRGVTIVEDAAQAMGETWDGRKLGTLGDVSFLSLARGKAFSTVEGGIILTDRDDIARVLQGRVDGLPGYGFWGLVKLIAQAAGLMLFIHPLLFWIPRSLPFLRLGDTLFEEDFPILRMSSFQAGLAENWRERLRSMREARKANVKRWMGMLEEIGDRGESLEHGQPRGLLRYPIRVRDAARRKSLLQESKDRGVGIAPVYPESINRLSELTGKIPLQACPVAESCARELVTLPTHAYLTQKDVAVVRNLLAHALQMKMKPL
jgi:perosamine synthetase